MARLDRSCAAARGGTDMLGRLRIALAAANRIADPDRGPAGLDTEALAHDADHLAAYTTASPLAHRRYEAVARETATSAAAGLRALLAGQGTPGARAAAAVLGREIDAAIAELHAILR